MAGRGDNTRAKPAGQVDMEPMRRAIAGCVRSIAGKHDLPLFSVPRIGAPKSYPPTQTHAYDFNAPMRHSKAE